MNDRDRHLRELLRRHDPAAGDPPPDESETVRLRRAVVLAAARPRPVSRPGLWGWAGAALAAALLLAALIRTASRPSPGVAEAPPPAAPDAVELAVTRQVQMVTPGGTRIVWILNRNLEL
ncbi:MAG TPA: hypothetical protein VJV23_15420 [Candidatus Polarisedimenticolia bacterium]|nr:hypothetical protein [Candidatus Polarisedimenticolia bacterium]